MSYITDGTYKSLSPKAQRMFSVVQDVRAYEDKERCLKNQFFHSIDTLADHANMSHKHAVYAIKELIDRGILKRYSRPGQSTIYEFIPCQPSVFRTPPPSVVRTPPPSVLKTPLTTVSEQIQLTTTDVELKSYNDLVRQFGKEKTDVVVKSLKGMNGDVNNFWGYARSALKNGYVPTNKNIQQAEKKEKHIKFVEEEAEKNRQEQTNNIEEFEKDYDPEKVKNIFADFMKQHEDDK